jgi:ABC-type transporter Mla MlaB component
MSPDGRLVLEGELTIRTIEALHARLRDLIAARAELEIDVAAAIQIDVNFVQLVLAARRSAEATGKTVALAAPADGALRDVLVRGGFLSPVAGHGRAADAWWLTETRAS